MKTVLFVHQSADLYGSDKVLLDLAMGIQAHGYSPVVLLPVEGPLLQRLRAVNIETHVISVASLNRAALSPNGLLRLPFEIFRAMRGIDRVVQGRRISVVHSNTLAVLGGAFWAWWRKVPHLWHVHELIISPRLARIGFPRLLKMLADKVICNSNMTAKWVLDEQPRLHNRIITVWNGIDPPQSVRQPKNSLIQSNTDNNEEWPATVTIALVGRINRLKGQQLLVEAATILWDRGIKHARFVVVGGPPKGQEHHLDNLRRLIDASPACKAFQLKDFMVNIWPVWEGCDIAVVPSTEPESFGLVAIEAMAASKPVVAAAHGGLLDIVEDGKTGILVPPGDALALADALHHLICDRGMRQRLGEAGRVRQQALFSLNYQVLETVRCYEQMTTRE